MFVCCFCVSWRQLLCWAPFAHPTVVPRAILAEPEHDVDVLVRAPRGERPLHPRIMQHAPCSHGRRSPGGSLQHGLYAPTRRSGRHVGIHIRRSSSDSAARQQRHVVADNRRQTTCKRQRAKCSVQRAALRPRHTSSSGDTWRCGSSYISSASCKPRAQGYESVGSSKQTNKQTTKQPQLDANERAHAFWHDAVRANRGGAVPRTFEGVKNSAVYGICFRISCMAIRFGIIQSGPSPGADVGAANPVPAQMWQGASPVPGAGAAVANPFLGQMWERRP